MLPHLVVLYSLELRVINYSQADFLQNGFEFIDNQIAGVENYSYRGKLLRYELIIDSNNSRVAISSDTREPFNSDSIYEFYLPCRCIIYRTEQQINYRYFHFSFFKTKEPSKESLVLTVSARKSDGELVVWPYF